jgi:hypothetical protein
MSLSNTRLALTAALLTAMLAAGIGGVAGSYLANLRGAVDTVAADHVRADALMYVEARLDLPGDQRAMFIELLDRFPGVDTERWMEEDLVRFLDESMAEGGLDERYAEDIAPWFDGRVAMAIVDMPASVDPFDPVVPDLVVFLGLTDTDAAISFADAVRAQAEADGATFSSSTHRGTTIWSLESDPFMGEMSSSLGAVYAVTDRFVILSMSETVVRATLDLAAGVGDSLADRPELRETGPRLPSNRVTLATVDVARIVEQSMPDLAKAAPELAETYRALLADQADFAVMTGRMAGDRIEFTSVARAPTGSLAVENTRRELAARIPADAFLFADGGRVGQSFQQGVSGIKAGLGAMPEGQLVLDELEQFELAFNTDLEDILAWAGDGAVVAGWDGDQPYGGVVLAADDAQAAAQLLGRLTAMIGLARMDPSLAEFVSLETATVAGAEVTTVTVALQPETGMDLEELMFQYVLHDDVVLIGFGDRFVQRVIELDEADSLAQSPRFQAAVQAVNGAESIGVVFLDLTAARLAAESAFAGDLDSGDYRRDVRPYLEPVSYLVASSRLDGDVVESLMLLVFE